MDRFKPHIGALISFLVGPGIVLAAAMVEMPHWTLRWVVWAVGIAVMLAGVPWLAKSPNGYWPRS